MRNGKTGLEVLEKPSPLDAEVALVQSDRKSDLERADVVPVLPRNRAGFAVALHLLDIELRYNERAGKPEFRHGDEEWSEFTERKESVLFEEIAARFNATTSRGDAPLRFKGQDRTDAVNSLLDDECIDPFEEWIQALPKWDGENRLSFLLSDLFGADKNPLVEWASRYPFLGAVWRTFRPGTKLDEVPVLIGPQGIGKSTVLDLAFPPDTEWFTDDLDLSAYRKERAETLQGRVIVEVSEMAGATRAELRSLKGFLSRRNDGGVRLAYRRNPESMPRRCVIIGTTNDIEPLPNDPSGNRRFVPIVLAKGNPKTIRTYMEKHREQLWAEALNLYRQGYEAWLPQQMLPMVPRPSCRPTTTSRRTKSPLT